MTSPKPDARSLHAQETSALLALGLPLVGSHLAQMSIHVSDILMLGWYDITSLAAASVAAARDPDGALVIGPGRCHLFALAVSW